MGGAPGLVLGLILWLGLGLLVGLGLVVVAVLLLPLGASSDGGWR